MTPSEFAHALCARGIELTLHGNRLRVWPARAYRHGLSNAEREYITAHRGELRALVLDGLPEATVAWNGTAPKAEPDLRCPFCYRVPCIGRDHPEFATLHALDAQEQQRQHAEQHKRDTNEYDMRRRFNLTTRWP